MKRFLIVLALIPLGLLALYLFVSYSSYPYNNFRLSQFGKQLTTTLPAKSDLIEEHHYLYTVGGSTTCNFHATIAIETSLDKENLYNFYNNVTISPVKPVEGSLVNSAIQPKIIELADRKYLIHIFDSHPENFDIRC